MPPGCGDPAAVRAFGVVFSMLGWPGGDYLAWVVAWLALSGYAFRMSGDARRFIPGVRPRPRVGVAHGVSADTHRRVHRHAPRQSPDHDLEPRIALVPIQNPNSGSLSTRSGLTAVAMLTCLGVAFSELRAGEWPFGGCAASGPYALVRGSRALRASLRGRGGLRHSCCRRAKDWRPAGLRCFAPLMAPRQFIAFPSRAPARLTYGRPGRANVAPEVSGRARE
jgi:hypothetical protein